MRRALLARSVALVIAATLTCGAGAAPAAKTSGWVIDTTGGTSASISNASQTMTLTLGCVAPDLGMTVSWKGARIDNRGTFSATLGKTSFPLHPGKARNALLLSDLPGTAVGLDKAFLDAMRTGDALVLGGTAFAAVASADLSFPLAGSGKALKAVSAACKTPSAPAPAARPAVAGSKGTSDAPVKQPAKAAPAAAKDPVTTGSIKQVALAEGGLSPKEMQAFVGHPVTHNPGTVDRLIYSYNGNGTYDVNGPKGRVDGGKYTIRADGQLCWDRAGGITGCFQYYRQSGKLRVRNMTSGADIGPASLG